MLTLFFPSSIRTSRKNITFDDKMINKNNFYKNKNPFNTDEIDVHEILVSKRESYGIKGSLN